MKVLPVLFSIVVSISSIGLSATNTLAQGVPEDPTNNTNQVPPNSQIPQNTGYYPVSGSG
jgi:hypothetical protein